MAMERQVALVVGDVRLVIDLNAGARAVSWRVGDHELLAHHADAPVQYGMYPMAPWAGRLRDNCVSHGGVTRALPVTHDSWALHGTVLSQPGAAVVHEQSAEEVRLLVRFDTHRAWPWAAVVDVEWVLRPRVLTTRISVQAGADAFPAVVGWHPWFRRELGDGRSLEWTLDASARLVRGDDHLPTGERVAYDPAEGPFDDAFVATCATVRWPGALRIDIASDGDWFVLFDELPDAVCVEPQSGPPDGLSPHPGYEPRIASAGRPVVLTTTWSISDEPPGDPA